MAPASTAATPPAGRRCAHTRSASPTRRLPCGTTVKFVYHGKALITQVIDRGPYVKGRAWDLTAAASEALGLEGVGRVRYAIATNLARKTAGH